MARSPISKKVLPIIDAILQGDAVARTDLESCMPMAMAFASKSRLRSSVVQLWLLPVPQQGKIQGDAARYRDIVAARNGQSVTSFK
jgi:hypothetical protein